MASHSRSTVPGIATDHSTNLKLGRSWLSYHRPRITDLATHRTSLKQFRCGVIHAVDGRFSHVDGRWMAYRPTIFRAWIDQRRSRVDADECQIFWSETSASPGFLAWNYLIGGSRLSLSTTKAALDVLDQIAEIKGASAIVAHLTNSRISERIAERLGWQRHARSLPGRHFIRRFYDGYPNRNAFPNSPSVDQALPLVKNQSPAWADNGSSFACNRETVQV